MNRRKAVATGNVKDLFKSVEGFGQVSERFPFERMSQRSNPSSGIFPDSKYGMIVVRTHYNGQVADEYFGNEGFMSLIDEFLIQELHRIYKCFRDDKLKPAGGDKAWSNNVFLGIVDKDKENGRPMLKKMYSDLKKALQKGEFVKRKTYKCPDKKCSNLKFNWKRDLVEHIVGEHNVQLRTFTCKKCDPPIELKNRKEYDAHQKDYHTFTCNRCDPPQIFESKEEYKKHYDLNHCDRIYCPGTAEGDVCPNLTYRYSAQGTKRVRDMQRHLKNHHSLEKEAANELISPLLGKKKALKL